jgi:hypothetical protein
MSLPRNRSSKDYLATGKRLLVGILLISAGVFIGRFWPATAPTHVLPNPEANKRKEGELIRDLRSQIAALQGGSRMGSVLSY